MDTFSKDELIAKLKAIRARGWIPNARHGNVGGIGNTLEDLLGIKENNLPIPNAAEWELKCQRAKTSSLITLFHMEPSPRALKFVPAILLPKYGWVHRDAGSKHKLEEMSFRQTISGKEYSDRGFKVVVDRTHEKVAISFHAGTVAIRHANWLRSVERAVGLAELNPQPYWGFNDLRNKAGSKLLNCFFVKVETRREQGKEFYHYSTIMMMEQFSLEGLL
jgi:hypothetical protein